MTTPELSGLLRWALPRLRLRVAAYRRVRGQVEKRVRRRIAALGLETVDAYRARLEQDPDEWEMLRGMCAITISRFYRDAAVWDALHDRVLPAIVDAARSAGRERVRSWSLGCASGEEPYTCSIVWELAVAPRYPGLRLQLEVVATDVDAVVLERARRGEYEGGSLRELPARWWDEAFERHGDGDGDGALYRLRERFRASVQLRREDVRERAPEGAFDLVLCRNNAFSYFDGAEQERVLQRLEGCMNDGGFLVVGKDEQLPAGSSLQAWNAKLGIHRRR